MSSTNKTAFLELSQYVSGDKPTYSVDYNTDMYKIDAGVKEAHDMATNNEENIGTLANLNTTAKNDLVNATNEVNTKTNGIGDLSSLSTTAKNTLVSAINETYAEAIKVGDLSSLQTTVKTDAVGAINELKGSIDNFNLSSYSTMASITSSDGTVTQDSSVKVAKNSDGSLAKVYGHIGYSATAIGYCNIDIPNSGLSPDSEFVINNAGFLRRREGTAYVPSSFDLTFKTNGTLTVTIYATQANQGFDIWLLPMLYWVKSFGDAPINNS